MYRVVASEACIAPHRRLARQRIKLLLHLVQLHQ